MSQREEKNKHSFSDISDVFKIKLIELKKSHWYLPDILITPQPCARDIDGGK